MNINDEVERIQILEQIHNLEMQNKATKLAINIKEISKKEYKEYVLRCNTINHLWDKIFQLEGVL
jgi:hypothetical protein